jgi:hypothetical protein
MIGYHLIGQYSCTPNDLSWSMGYRSCFTNENFEASISMMCGISIAPAVTALWIWEFVGKV